MDVTLKIQIKDNQENEENIPNVDVNVPSQEEGDVPIDKIQSENNDEGKSNTITPVQTGDQGDLVKWIISSITAGALIIFVVIKNKRKFNN